MSVLFDYFETVKKISDRNEIQVSFNRTIDYRRVSTLPQSTVLSLIIESEGHIKDPYGEVVIQWKPL